MNPKIFIQIILDKNSTKIKSTLPVIVEFDNLDFNYLKNNLKFKYPEVLQEQEDSFLVKNNGLEILVWQPKISLTKSNITKSKQAQKVEGLDRFDLITIDKINDYLDATKIKSFVDFVNQIIAWNQNSAKLINFWSVHMSIINWIYFVSYNFDLNYLINPQWKKTAFKIITNEQEASMQANFLTYYGFVDFIVVSESKNLNNTKAIFEEILREALNLQDEKENVLLKKIYANFKYTQKLDRDKKYLVIYTK